VHLLIIEKISGCAFDDKNRMEEIPLRLKKIKNGKIAGKAIASC